MSLFPESKHSFHSATDVHRYADHPHSSAHPKGPGADNKDDVYHSSDESDSVEEEEEEEQRSGQRNSDEEKVKHTFPI